jgi:D-alanyl-D-alanine carboxypeptidase
VIAALVLLAGGAGIGYALNNSSSAQKLNDLQAKYDAVQTQLDNLGPRIHDYEAGLDEAKNISRSGDQGDAANSSSSTDNSSADSSTKLTPATATEPFTKDNVIVVNKKHPLPQDYAPGENAEAAAAAHQFVAAAQAAGVDVLQDNWSSYRSYTYQAGLYNNYVNQSGQAAADTYSARPGYSEHQTGLAFDLKDSTGQLYRNGDDSYDSSNDWLAQHCAEYGFILRYKDAWQGITGYVGEPWHFRYLGKDLAQKVTDSGKTLEEYLSVDGGESY